MVTHEQLADDLETITSRGYQWKMVLNPDITKQAVEAIFSDKKGNQFIHIHSVTREDSTKHLGAHLDRKLNFSKLTSTEAVRMA